MREISPLFRPSSRPRHSVLHSPLRPRRPRNSPLCKDDTGHVNSGGDTPDHSGTTEFVYDTQGHLVHTEAPNSGTGWRGEVFAGNRHLATYAGSLVFETGDRRTETGETGGNRGTDRGKPGDGNRGTDGKPGDRRDVF
jgi:hypothetical protein